VGRLSVLAVPEQQLTEYIVRVATYTRRSGSLIVWLLTLRDKIRWLRTPASEPLRPRRIVMEAVEHWE
jgi:hypothetical protein